MVRIRLPKHMSDRDFQCARKAVGHMSERGVKIYPHDFTMSHFLIALFVAIDTMLVVSSNPAGNFRESAR